MASSRLGNAWIQKYVYKIITIQLTPISLSNGDSSYLGGILRSSENMLESIDLCPNSVCNSKNKNEPEQSKCLLVEKCINTRNLLVTKYQYG